MATVAEQLRRRVSRAQLAEVFKSHELVVAFEKIIAATEATPATIAEVKLIADQALELANALVLGAFQNRHGGGDVPLTGESVQLVDAVRAFLPRPQPVPDVQPGTATTVTRNAQGWVVAAMPDDAQHILANRIFGW